MKSVLWVSADGLRVVDDKTKVGGSGWQVGLGERAPEVPCPHPAQMGPRVISYPPLGCPSFRDLPDYTMGFRNILHTSQSHFRIASCGYL